MRRSPGAPSLTARTQLAPDNAGAYNALGYSLADLQGKPHSQLCFPDYANSLDYRAFWDRLRRGEPFSDRVRRRTADGREIWLEATYCPVRDAQGQIESFSKYASDITASVDAEVHNQARLNAINRAMAVIEFSPDGTVLDANENFLNVLGYRLDEVKGRHHRLFCDNEFAQSPEYQALWRQLARGEYYSGQIKRQAKNGAVRWLEAISQYGGTVSGGPDFAYRLCSERVAESALQRLDLSGWRVAFSGSEPIRQDSLERFAEKFAASRFEASSFFACYGLAEATVYVGSGLAARKVPIVRFDYEKLAAGYAKRCEEGAGVELIGHGYSRSCTFRIVDPETSTECPSDRVGEVWVHGDNVAAGYWRRPAETQQSFEARMAQPTPGTPEGPWLRTGDLGFLSGGELFIVGRIKDLLIVRGRNHYPDDIEATITAISGCRSVALVVQGADAEELVAIVETKKRGNTEDEIREHLAQIENSVHSAISESHGIAASELVLVSRGAIPLTTSGKIRRQACVERYVSGAFERVR